MHRSAKPGPESQALRWGCALLSHGLVRLQVTPRTQAPKKGRSLTAASQVSLSWIQGESNSCARSALRGGEARSLVNSRVRHTRLFLTDSESTPVLQLGTRLERWQK